MNRVRAFAAIVLFVPCVAAHAAAYEDELLRMNVPTGFVGPLRQSYGADAISTAYTKPHTGDRGTLLQLTIVKLGSHSPKPPKAELGASAEKYLLQFLGAVERRRTSFEASKPNQLELGGLPAARVTWRGIAQGAAMFGTMYCVIVGAHVVSFHIQDFEGAPPENTSDAIRSIESVQFKYAG